MVSFFVGFACESSPRPVDRTQLQLRIGNQTDLPVRVRVQTARRGAGGGVEDSRRSSDAPAPGTASSREPDRLDGPELVINPKETTTYAWFADMPRQWTAADPYRRVTRVRVEVIQPTWRTNDRDSDRVLWYVLANPLAGRVNVEKFELGGITLRSAETRIHLVPRSECKALGLD